jgi:hypothetical protein
MYLYEYVMVILQSFSVKALLTDDNSNNSSSSVTITANNNNNSNLITKQLKQDSIPFRKGIYDLVLAKQAVRRYTECRVVD